MMNNVNLSLAFFSVVFRKFYEKIKISKRSSFIPNHPFWQKQLLHVRPYMYLSMLCIGLYYTYKQVDQRRNILPLRRNNRMLQIKDHIRRRKFIDKNNGMLNLKNLAKSDKGHKEVLKVLDKISQAKVHKSRESNVYPIGEPCPSTLSNISMNSKLHLKQCYSDTSIRIESPSGLLNQTYSPSKLQENVNNIDKETNTYYTYLPIYRNFENNRNVSKDIPCKRQVSTENVQSYNKIGKRTNLKVRRRKKRKPYTPKRKPVAKNVLNRYQRRKNKPQPEIDINNLIRRTRSGKIYNRNMMSAQLNNANFL